MSRPVAVRTPPCFQCGESSVVFMDESAYERLCRGEHVQNVLPLMSADERELLISGTHPKCWDEMFSGDDQ